MPNRSPNLKHLKCHGLLNSYDQIVIEPFIAGILLHKCNFEKFIQKKYYLKCNNINFFHLLIQLRSFLVRTKCFEALRDLYKPFNATFAPKSLKLCANST